LKWFFFSQFQPSRLIPVLPRGLGQAVGHGEAGEGAQDQPGEDVEDVERQEELEEVHQKDLLEPKDFLTSAVNHCFSISELGNKICLVFPPKVIPILVIKKLNAKFASQRGKAKAASTATATATTTSETLQTLS